LLCRSIPVTAPPTAHWPTSSIKKATPNWPRIIDGWLAREATDGLPALVQNRKTSATPVRFTLDNLKRNLRLHYALAVLSGALLVAIVCLAGIKVLRAGQAHLAAASSARRMGDYETANHHLKVYESQHGPSDELTLERTLLRVQSTGPSTEDDRYLREQLDQGRVEALIVFEALTLGYHQTQQVTATLHCSTELLQVEPDHVKGLLAHGWALERLDRMTEALEDYQRAALLDPENLAARLYLGEMLLHFRRSKEALEHFEWLSGKQPANVGVLFGLARCRQGMGDFDEAARILDGLLESNPDEATLLDARGQVAMLQGELPEAERFLREAVELAPYLRNANFNLSQCLQRRGLPEEARKYQQKVDRIDADMKRLAELHRQLMTPSHTPVQCYEAGVLSLRLGRDEEAERWLQTAVQEDPDFQAAHQALADFYPRRGDRRRAEYHRLQAERKDRRR
jgi:tetratricopeptide (TPR) repeat protein